MSLTVYKHENEIPKDIKLHRNNDIYFNAHTFIPNTELAKKILKDIDCAEYIDKQKFKGRTDDIGDLYKQYLSTGAKTLLNIISHTDECFDVKECGSNAIDFLCNIKEGNILWEKIVMFPEADNEVCDIVFQNKHYTNIFDFLEEVKDLC